MDLTDKWCPIALKSLTIILAKARAHPEKRMGRRGLMRSREAQFLRVRAAKRAHNKIWRRLALFVITRSLLAGMS